MTYYNYRIFNMQNTVKTVSDWVCFMTFYAQFTTSRKFSHWIKTDGC